MSFSNALKFGKKIVNDLWLRGCVRLLSIFRSFFLRQLFVFFEDVPLSAVSKSKKCLPFASLLLSSREISLSNGLWDCHGPMDPSVPSNL